MSEIKRYALTVSDLTGKIGVYPDDAGQYVLASDHDTILAERERELQSKIVYQTEQIADLISDDVMVTLDRATKERDRYREALKEIETGEDCALRELRSIAGEALHPQTKEGGIEMTRKARCRLGALLFASPFLAGAAGLLFSPAGRLVLAALAIMILAVALVTFGAVLMGKNWPLPPKKEK